MPLVSISGNNNNNNLYNIALVFELEKMANSTSVTEATSSTAGMGRPIPHYPQVAQDNNTVTVNTAGNIRRPPPLNLSEIPDDETYEWYASFFTRFYRLLKQAEDSFPLLAQYHRNVADALADTPTPRGPIVWESAVPRDGFGGW